MPKTKEQIQKELENKKLEGIVEELEKEKLKLMEEEIIADLDEVVEVSIDDISIGNTKIGGKNKSTYIVSYGKPRGATVMAIKVYKNGEHVGYIPVYRKLWP